MTIYILAAMLFVTSCNNIRQHLSESDIKKSISLLYEKKILHTSYDTLFLKLNNFEIREDSLKEINVDGKLIFLNYKQQGVPFIVFNQFPSTTDENQVLIRFIIKGGGGYRYEGVINFKLIGDQFKIISCNYYSEVE